MKILVVGSGGREHALYNKFVSEGHIVYLIGDSAGVSDEFLFKDVLLDDINKIVSIAHDFDLVVVGPELPLACGLIDELEKEGILCFGPNKYCAQIETSKKFAKEVMANCGVATARYVSVDKYQDGVKALEEFSYPVVFKYSGLAAGKGVLIINNRDEAIEQLFLILVQNCFGEDSLIIEEFLEGEEFSCFYNVSNGQVQLLGVAQDYKRAYDGDLGLNTGGMGAHTTDKFNEYLSEIETSIIKPVIEEINYSGFLYAGLINTAKGIYVIEFNCRLGDPETQVILPKIKSSLATSICSILNGEITPIKQNKTQYLGVVVAANGYPQKYVKDIDVKDVNDMIHMATRKSYRTKSTGGRVFMVVDSGSSVRVARKKVYNTLASYENENLFWRSDIGLKKV